MRTITVLGLQSYDDEGERVPGYLPPSVLCYYHFTRTWHIIKHTNKSVSIHNYHLKSALGLDFQHSFYLSSLFYFSISLKLTHCISESAPPLFGIVSSLWCRFWSVTVPQSFSVLTSLTVLRTTISYVVGCLCIGSYLMFFL